MLEDEFEFEGCCFVVGLKEGGIFEESLFGRDKSEGVGVVEVLYSESGVVEGGEDTLRN